MAHPSEPRASRKVEAGASEVRVPFSCIVSEFLASVGCLRPCLKEGRGGVQGIWPGMMAQACNPRIWEVETGISGHPWLSSEFKASMGYLISCLNPHSHPSKSNMHQFCNPSKQGVGVI